MRGRAVSLALALALSACGSYAEDVAALCDAPKNAVAPPGSTASERSTRMAMTAAQRLQTSRGKELLASMATLAPLEKAATLRQEAAAQGVSSCAWADWYEAAARPAAPTTTATTATATTARP